MVCDSYREGKTAYSLLTVILCFPSLLLVYARLISERRFFSPASSSPLALLKTFSPHIIDIGVELGFFSRAPFVSLSLSLSTAKQKNKVNFVTNDRLSIDTTTHAGHFLGDDRQLRRASSYYLNGNGNNNCDKGTMYTYLYMDPVNKKSQYSTSCSKQYFSRCIGPV